MRRERFIKSLQYGWADASLADEDYGFKWVGKTAQVAALRAVEARTSASRAGLRGRFRLGSRGVAGHENLRLRDPLGPRP